MHVDVMRRRLAWGGLLLLVLIVLIGTVQLVWAGWHLRGAGAEVTRARGAALDEGLPEAREAVLRAHEAAERASWGTAGPHLWLAEHLPVVGDDIAAARTLVEVTEELTGPVAEDLLEARAILDPRVIGPVGGRIDLDRIATAAGPTSRAAARLARLDARAGAIEVDRLVGPLERRTAPAVADLHRLAEGATYAADIIDLLPEALGADRPRRYLLLFQNNAEFRSTGGLIGAFAVLEARDGELTLTRQGNARQLAGGMRPRDVLPITAEEEGLFHGKLGAFVQDANLTPDWPRVGEIVRTVWQRNTPGRVDGVLGVDPGTLAHMMEGTGPIRLADGRRATAETIVALLLNQPYLTIQEPEQQDAFFADSARRVFDALVEGRGDSAAAMRGLLTAAREGRLYLWMANQAEQEAVEGSVVDGQLTRRVQERPQVGVFLNDSNATKLDYYVTTSTDVTRVTCRSDGGQRLAVTTTLRSTVPANAAELPPSLVGRPATGVPGEVLVTVLGYGSRDGSISASTINGERGAPALHTHLGHPVVARTVNLEPGEAIRLRFLVDTAAGQSGEPLLRTTPSARTSGRGRVEASACP